MVDANGRKTCFPKIENLKSPGKRPIPSFSSHGSKEENKISARKIIISQRNIKETRKASTYIQLKPVALIQSGQVFWQADTAGQ